MDRQREARRSRRYALMRAPAVQDEFGGRLLGRALDISAGGLKLLVSEPIPENTLFQVRFELDMGGGQRVPVVAGLQVLDQRPDENGLLCTGARFIHLEGQHARILVNWLQSRDAAD
ncbi:MAG: PilZ domain-containing protein [Luteimonas sp.]